MKVFISHTFVDDDQELAVKLQKILATENIDGYLAEKKKEYDLLIRDKIRKEIERSDHMIAIVTNKARESASVNQELGYALREGIKPIILLEKEAKTGVLTHGIEHEEFTRPLFEDSCVRVREHIVKKGKRKRLLDEDKKHLRNNIYTPLYNNLSTFLENPVNNRKPPPDFWSELTPSDKLKIEEEIKNNLEIFSKHQKIWRNLFQQYEIDYKNSETGLARIIESTFEMVNLLNSNREIILDNKTSISSHDWLHNFIYVIFDKDVKDENQLFWNLCDYSQSVANGHDKYLKYLYDHHPEVFLRLFEALPMLHSQFKTEITTKMIKNQREILRSLADTLKKILETKLLTD